MAHPAASPDDTLDRIVRILERNQPELAFLFGSRASGDARADSDYDLLLVVRDDTVVEATRRAVYDGLREIPVSADVLVHSVEQYERHQHDPGFLDYLIARNGRLLYATGAVPVRSSPAQRVREGPPDEGFAEWIRRADRDLRTAEQSLAAPDPVWDSICFHSHACVEKLLKALIVRAGTFPPKTHELKELLTLQEPDVGSDIELGAACALLAPLFPKSRYPEASEPTPDEAREAIAAARFVRQRLRPRLGR
jgi:HEPN domain-containing protein/predicted nucleotidyltransferase